MYFTTDSIIEPINTDDGTSSDIGNCLLKLKISVFNIDWALFGSAPKSAYIIILITE